MLKVKPFLQSNKTLVNSLLKREYENLINNKYEKFYRNPDYIYTM